MRYLMSGRRGVLAGAAGLGLALFAPVTGAAQGSQTKQPTPQQQPAAGQTQPQGTTQNPAPPQPPVNKEEEDAYKAFFNLPLSQGPQVISQGEDFIAKYSTSRYRPSVFAKLLAAYLNTGQAGKLVIAGEEAIREDPNNVAALALMASTLPRTVDPKSLDADQKLSEAERCGRRAIDLTAASAKPDGVTDEQFAAAKNERLGLAHTGLGLVFYMRGDTARSVEEFDQATKLDPTPDMLAFYLLGDGNRKLGKFAEASAAFERCSKSPWAWQDRCKQLAQDAKKMAAAAPAAKP